MSMLNRRAVLASTASLPAVALPAFATEFDPAFAAIEARWQVAQAGHGGVLATRGAGRSQAVMPVIGFVNPGSQSCRKRDQ